MKQLDNGTIENTHFESLYPLDTREKEIAKILDFVKKGSSCQVVGIPGVGRSSLLRLLSYNRKVRIRHLGENQKWFHFVYMDMQEVKRRPFYDVLKFILLSLAYSLSERSLNTEYERVNAFLKEAIEEKDDLVLFQALKRSIDYLAIEKELTVVLLFDLLEEYLPSITPDFFTNLRVLRSRAKYRFSVVFSLARPLEEILERGTFAEFHDFLVGNIIFLPLFDPAGLKFRLSYIEKVTGRKNEVTRKEIIRICSGHAQLTRLSYEAVLADNKTLNSKLLESLLSQKRVEGALLDIWNSLLPQEQQILKGIAVGRETEGITPYLEEVGLIKNRKITIPIFQEFVKTIKEEVSREITYDLERSEILKAGDPITDRLSPLEFRLLRFLIVNHGRICEKEEIINSVWQDAKTREGVTDQALDQIVYRLRKKIEENPNNPYFIQTIKGRGYRFQSE